LSQYTVLPWEDGEEYRALLEALVAEHRPQGPTEEHLVEELTGVIWRKRRLRMGRAPFIIAPSSAPPTLIDRRQGRHSSMSLEISRPTQ
jgi:hypothetical protein